MSSLGNALRKAASSLQKRADRASDITLRLGTISSIVGGASLDGVAAATVAVRGTSFVAPYLSSYTPTLNDMVLVALIDKSPVILGKVIGLPSF